MAKIHATVPVFYCNDDGLGMKGQLCFICPYCKTKHMHGPMSGHRRPHCLDPDGPFQETGYHLRRNVDNENRF